MSDLDGAIFGSIDDFQFFDTPDMARPGSDDEQFERWLADVSATDFERLLDDLLADPRSSQDAILMP